MKKVFYVSAFIAVIAIVWSFLIHNARETVLVNETEMLEKKVNVVTRDSSMVVDIPFYLNYEENVYSLDEKMVTKYTKDIIGEVFRQYNMIDMVKNRDLYTAEVQQRLSEYADVHVLLGTFNFSPNRKNEQPKKIKGLFR